jgi:hypothetical protein
MPQVAMGSEDRPNNHRERISTSLTFRLDQDNVKKLRIEAQKKGITLNPFVNQTLKSFLEWHIFEPKVGFVSVLKPVVKEVFTRISKEQVTQKSKILFTLLKERLIWILFDKSNSSNNISIFRISIRILLKIDCLRRLVTQMQIS